MVLAILIRLLVAHSWIHMDYVFQWYPVAAPRYVPREHQDRAHAAGAHPLLIRKSLSVLWIWSAREFDNHEQIAESMNLSGGSSPRPMLPWTPGNSLTTVNAPGKETSRTQRHLMEEKSRRRSIRFGYDDFSQWPGGI